MRARGETPSARPARRPVWLGALALAACSVPYQPAQASLDGLPEDAFRRCVDVVRASYPRLVLVSESSFRIQSGWLPHDRDGLTGSKRASVCLDEDRLLTVVVETRYLGMDLWGQPTWSSVRGDRELERELLASLVAALTPAPEEPR